MKKLTTAILLVTMTMSMISCKKDLIGEGPVMTETRSVGNFTAIDLRMNGSVYFKTDTSTGIEITAKQSILSILETTVSNGKLTIRYKNGKTYDADETIRINVSAPSVNSFELSTSGSIYSLFPIQAGSLFLHSSGSGNISFQNVTATNVDASSTMSGKITATGGSATSIKAKTDGSGTIDLSAIAAQTAIARIVGSGDIRLKVSAHLDATIDGSGDIYFRGNPTLSTHLNGSGHLIKF
jgi:hypothetical protein